MKKILKKFAMLAASVLLAGALVSCGSGDDEEPQKKDSTDNWDWSAAGTTVITDLDGKEINWGKDENGLDTTCMLPSKYTARLQKDSKVVFYLQYNTIASDYIEFHVDDGAWGSVGVKDFYNAKGVKVASEEEIDNGAGTNRYKIKAEPGVYYFVVTEELLDTLKNGFAFNGNFKLVKLAITNLADPEPAITEFAANGIGNVITFNVNAGSTGTANKITLKYLRTAPSAKEQLILQDVVYYVQHNNDEIVKKTGTLNFALNAYGNTFDEVGGYLVAEGVALTDNERVASGKYKDNSTELKDPATDAAEYQVELTYDEELAAGDTVKFQLVSAKAVVESGATLTKDDILPKIKAILIDADPAVDYYKELFAQLSAAEGVYPKVIKDGATVEEGEEIVEEERPAIGTIVYTASGSDLTISLPVNHYDDADHGVQFAADGSTYLPLGAKAGEYYQIVMKGTASEDFAANVQFLDAGWGGLVSDGDGSSITMTDFTEEAFELTMVRKFNQNTAEGFRFVIGNPDSALNTAKTLTLTEFTITRVAAPSSEPGVLVGTSIVVEPNIYKDPNAEEATNHGLQYTKTAASIFGDDLPKAGDTYILRFVGTSDEAFEGMMQFVNASWTGITGEAVSETFSTEGFDITASFDFSEDLPADGMFQLFNTDVEATEKTLTVTTFVFEKSESGE